MTIDQIKETRRIAEEKIAYEMSLLEKQTGMVITHLGAMRRDVLLDQPANAFRVEIDMQLPD